MSDTLDNETGNSDTYSVSYKCFFTSILNKYAAIDPAYTTARGKGIITNNVSPEYPNFFTDSPIPFFALWATQSALFLYQCHLVNQRLIFSRKNIVNGKTRILAIIASNNTRYGFRSLSKPYGIPALAYPSGDKLHKIVIMNSSTIEQIIPQRNVHVSHWFINKLIINQSFLTVSDKH